MTNENTETVSLAQLANDRKPTEFKTAVAERLGGLLRVALDNKKIEVANQLFNKQDS